MAFLSLLLFLGLSHLLQKGPYLVKTENIIVYDEELTVFSGQILIVNTTAGRARLNSISYNLSIVGHSFNKWNYTVAHLVFTKDIAFKEGSTVTVTGSNALCIESKEGSIAVRTSINMTCTTNEMDNGTCRGGYEVSNSPRKTRVGLYFYPGLGPGINIRDSDWDTQTLDIGSCIPSSGHGGYGGCQEKDKKCEVPFYGREQNITLGGSGGTCAKYRGGAAGGGALELVALNGRITISGSIDANAQSTSVNCSGGSGGLIRLKAKEANIKSGATLSVDGASPQCNLPIKCHGGAGGVIQIIASSGVIQNGSKLMLYKGTTKNCENFQRKSEDGFLFIKDSNGTIHYNSTGTTFPSNGSFLWGTPLPPLSTSSEMKSTPTIEPSTTVSKTKTMTSSLTASVSATLGSGSGDAQESLKLIENTSRNISTESLNRILDALRKIKDNEFLARTEPRVLQNFTKDLLEVANVTLDKLNVQTWIKNSKKMMEFLQLMEDIVTSISKRTSNYTAYMKNIAVVAVKHGKNVIKNITLPTSAESLNFSQESRVELSLEGLEDGFTLSIILFKIPGKEEHIKNQTANMTVISSSVMSCSLLDANNNVVRTLNRKARIYFELKKGFGQTQKNCSYWDTKNGLWSQKGVENGKEGDETHIECIMTHFSNFAVLIGVPPTVSEEHTLALSIISYIGSAISVGGLALTLIVYLSMEVLHSERLKIHANLAFALLCGHIVFLSGMSATDNQALCKAIAVIMHYFFLTAFDWMLIEGIHLYLKVIQVYGSENINMRFYYVFGWAFSAFVVGISAGIRPNSYGTEEACWLSTDNGLFWAFLGPVISFSTINLVILIKVSKTVTFSASGVANPDEANIKAGAKCVGVLMPILGLGWVFGLFAFQKDATIVFQYLFAIANSSQGLFIFLFFCVFNQEVRAAFRRRKEKQSLTKSLGYANDQSITVGERQGNSDTMKKGKASYHLEKLKKSISIKSPIRSGQVVHVKPLTAKEDARDSPLLVSRTFQRQENNKKTRVEPGINCPGAIN